MSGRPIRLVVAGAVFDEFGRALLVAQRRYPAEVAGLWELPGGKVEDGESPGEALRRELAEELGVDVEVGERIGRDVPLRDDLTLIAICAQIVSGRPEPIEHSSVRWVDADELAAMARDGRLIPADAVWAPDLIEELGRRG